MNKKLSIFYHCYLVNNWRYVVKSQLEKLYNSGLYNECEYIYCKVLCDTDDTYIEFRKLLESYPKIDVERVPFTSHEYHAVNCLHNFCKLDLNNEYNVLYFNTKGVTRPNNMGDAGWRNVLDYFNIEKYKDCVNLLNTTNHSVCGAELGYVITRDNKNYWWNCFSGNYWWAKSEYIKTLEQPVETSDRQVYELWLLHSNRIHWHNNIIDKYDYNGRKILDYACNQPNMPIIDNRHVNPYCFYKSISLFTEYSIPVSLYRNDNIQNSRTDESYIKAVTVRLLHLKTINHKFGKDFINELSKHYACNFPKWVFSDFGWEE